MAEAAINPDDSRLLHPFVISRSDFSGKSDDSGDNQDLTGVNCHQGERDQPQTEQESRSD
jgi:hypothetical protein